MSNEELTNEELLEQAREAQTAFWDALRDLEEALGVEVDADNDLENETIESLMARES